MASQTFKRLLIDEVRAAVEHRIVEILQTEGPEAELTIEKIMPVFEDWVLPDHHLDLIRERLAYWNDHRSHGPEQDVHG